MVATAPPRTGEQPPEGGEAARCLVHIDTPATWTSPTGHHFCQLCRESWNNLHLGEIYQTYKHEPVDLDELLAGDPPTEEWYVEPLLPKGKLIGITSAAGHGKSLLLLDIACKKATGEAILEQGPGEPEHVVYLDMEMGPDELYDRLNDLGYDREHAYWPTLVEHLHYYQLIALPPLNTEEGGHALEEIIDRHQATFLVIDTLARVIAGNENDAEPYQELFRHTETMLKRRALTLARLDHLGKDISKGSRGSSAKVDGLDVVWQMEQLIQGTMQFKRVKGRQVWVAEHTTIHRIDTAGTVYHTTDVEPVSQKILDLVALLDGLQIDPATGANAIQKILKAAGIGKKRVDLLQAVKFRKNRNHPGTTPGNQFGNQAELTPETPLLQGNHPGNHSELGKGGFPSLRDGTTPPDNESDFEEAYHLLAESVDPADLEED